MRGLVLSGSKGTRLRGVGQVSLVVNVPTEPSLYAELDEYRLEANGTLPYDWRRKDG